MEKMSRTPETIVKIGARKTDLRVGLGGAPRAEDDHDALIGAPSLAILFQVDQMSAYGR